MVCLDRFEGDDCAGEVSGDKYNAFRLRELILGVSTLCSGVTSAKLTFLRGVIFCEALWLSCLLTAARVISCNWRPDLDSALDPRVEVRGVKKRVRRLGVMGGGFLGFRLPEVVGGIGGGELASSGSGSLRSVLRGAHGEDDIVDLATHVR